MRIIRVFAESAFAPLVVAAAGTAVAIRFNDSSEQWIAALVGWTVGWLFTLIAVARWEQLHSRPVFGQPAPDQPSWRRIEVVTLAIVFLVAGLLRTVAIESYPIGLHNDEMRCLVEARGFLAADTALFNAGWFGCPNLGFFLTSLPARVFGPTLSVLRLTSALLGMLSLVAVYLIVRRFFGVRPALLLTILTVPFHWHLHYSRTGFHYMQAASLTAVAVLIFAVALDRRSPVLFGCAGAVTGIAWQTYYAAWLIPILLVAWSLARLLSDREQKKTIVSGLVVTSVLFSVTLAPLLVHYLEEPHSAIARSQGVFLFSESNREHVAGSYGTSDPLQILLINATRLAGLLVGSGGEAAGQYGLQARFIDPFLLLLFLAGLAYALTLVRSPGGQLVWIWFLGTMIFGGLLTIDAPFSPRLVGITPLILIFPALVIDRVLQFDWMTARRSRIVAGMVLVGLIIVSSAWWNVRTTFVRFPSQRRFDNRELIVRLAADLGHVRTIANFCEPENFPHQAYKALVPEARGMNLDHAKGQGEDYAEIVAALGPRTLVIYPLGDATFRNLCGPVGGNPSGAFDPSHAVAGFRWCFVE